MYISVGAIPTKKLDDALHIAIATLSGMDILASWNCAHIVKFRTQQAVHNINTTQGYNIISINTPKEIISHE